MSVRADIKSESQLVAGLATGKAPSLISFESGLAYPGALPDLTDLARIVLSDFRHEALQYAPRPGLTELRSWITDYLREEGVTDISIDNVLVVNGAKHGIELACRALLNPGDAVVVSAPTYFTAIPIFKSFGVNFLEIGQDAEGLDVEELSKRLAEWKEKNWRLPKFVYEVPDFHNPSGVTMSGARRQRLLEVCSEHGVPILEDSPYRKVRFEGQSQPPLKALDRTGMVIMLGTFSKLLAPGLRIGWVAAREDWIGKMLQLKSDGGACPLTQRLIIEFCRRGRLQEHIARVQNIYRRHRDRMVAALRRDLPGASFCVPEGGYYLWLTLPESVDADEIAQKAEQRGVHLISGSKFFAGAAGAARRNNHIRLAYSYAAPEEIDEGVSRLAEIVNALENK